MPYETEFSWPWPASSVILTGSFDNWSRSVQLTKTGNGFSGKVPLPYGAKVSFKFIVDGNWTTHAYFPTERDPHGNLNNILYTPVEPPKKPEPAPAPVAKEPEVPAEPPVVEPVPVPEPKKEEPKAIPAFDVDPRVSRSVVETLAETSKTEEPTEPLKKIADEAPATTEVISNAAKTVVAAVTSIVPGLDHKDETTVSPPKEAPSEAAAPTSVAETVQEEVKQKVEEIPEISAAEDNKVAGVAGPVADTIKDTKEEKIPAPEEIPTVDLGDEEHVVPKSEEVKPTETDGHKPELSPSPSAAGPAVVEVPKTPTENVGEPVVTTAATVPAAPTTPTKEKPTHKSHGSVSAPVTPATIGRSSSVYTSGTSDTNATPTSKRNKWMNRKDSSESGSPMKTLKEEGTPGKKKRHSFIHKIKDIFK